MDDSPLDLAYLRDLLDLLREKQVKGFTLGNMAVSFHDLEAEVQLPAAGRSPEEVVVDEGRSTSSRRVRGFDGDRSIWQNPSLWPAQGGRPLKFDGSTE